MTEDVWARIARLRIKDVDLLAPVIKHSVLQGLSALGTQTASIQYMGETHTISLKTKVVETLRVQELQEIYFQQKTSKVSDVMRGSHAYGIAVDLISEEYDWFTGKAAAERWPDRKVREAISLLWYRRLAAVVTADNVMAWGGLWKKFPDSPHFQSARTPVSPNHAMREAYLKAGGGLAGRQAVWSMFGLSDVVSV